AAAGGLGAEAAGPAEPDRRQLGPGGGSRGESARRSEASRTVAAAWAGADSGPGPRGAGGFPGGPAPGPDPPEPGAVSRRATGWSLGAPARSDASGGGPGGGAVGRGGPEAVPEGDPELRAGLVGMLRLAGPAADEQRSGARLREPS